MRTFLLEFPSNRSNAVAAPLGKIPHGLTKGTEQSPRSGVRLTIERTTRDET